MMYEPTKGREIVSNASRDDWLESRKEWVGASEAAALFGMSRFESLYSLWARKSGIDIEVEETLHMQRGRRFETAIIEEVEEHGEFAAIEAWDQSSCVVDREIRLGCTPDSFLRDADGMAALGQVKLSDPRMKKYWEDGAPLEYLIQCQAEMEATGVYLSYLIVVFGLSEPAQLVRVEYNPKFAEELRVRLADFWSRVSTGQKPDPDGSDATLSAIQAMYGADDGTGVNLTDDCEVWASEFAAVKEQIKALEKEEKALKAKLIDAIGGHTYARFGDQVYSYKEQTRTSLDTKALRKDHPDFFEEYKKESSYRVLRPVKNVPKDVEFETDWGQSFDRS